MSETPPRPIVSILTLIIGILLLAVSSLIALVYAIGRAEEGYEDSTGYHRKAQSPETTLTAASAVDSGTPWDQVEGANCPINLSQPFPPLRHS